MSRAEKSSVYVGEREENKGAGHGCDALAAACEAHALRRCGFYSHAVGRNAQNLGDPGLHGWTVGTDAGFFAQECHIDIGDASPPFVHAPDGIGQE